MSSGSETTKTGQQETAARGSSRREMSDEETPDIMPDRTLSPEEAEADYQAQLALLRQQTAEYEASQQAAKEDEK
ncbi:hypothetical protein C2857_000260 [Epichloe festucae Fl1]|uniref:Uncharacterized protein n=1 Tax=Epichloe festucae (strain Fl1) TaxID=877507 RepID=A0A7S9KN04_EPIFF|nr:hypothetical protein C2857_000260 [Epichloe festucae Fl1]